jgi:hypothetical protein
MRSVAAIMGLLTGNILNYPQCTFLLPVIRILMSQILAAVATVPITSATSSLTRLDWRLTVVKQESRQRYRITQANTRALLPELFPESPQRSPAAPWRIAARAVLSVLALVVGAVVMLLRIAGRSPLTTIWAEDRTVFLVQALASPWRPFSAYAGYLQLLPRLIAQFVSFFPLRDAAAAFAIAGAVIASAMALFVFHASAGHVRSGWLRALLAAAILLLPVAPLEIADSGVNTPWYLLFALFWAALWRPRRGCGTALAALIAFLAGASTPMALAIAPLLALRIVALPRIREHAVTAGLAAGLLLQVPVIASARDSRVDQLARPGGVLDFVAHDVVLPALGWHLDWWLQAAVGRTGATLLVGCVLAAVFCAIAITQSARVRLLVAAALVCGFLLAAAAASLSRWVTVDAMHFHVEPGSRYTTLPIFLMEAAVIVAVDNALQRARDRVRADDQAAAFGVRPWTGWARARGATAAVIALVAVLSIGWITDFRSDDGRAGGALWAPIASRWLADCQRTPQGSFQVPSPDVGSVVIRCTSLRR